MEAEEEVAPPCGTSLPRVLRIEEHHFSGKWRMVHVSAETADEGKTSAFGLKRLSKGLAQDGLAVSHASFAKA